MTRVTLRLPDAVHQQLTARARREDVSLNTLLVELLSAAADSANSPRADAPLDEQLAYLRRQLRDLLVDSGPPAPVAPLPTPPAEPRLEPPLSATIIEEREDRL